MSVVPVLAARLRRHPRVHRDLRAGRADGLFARAGAAARRDAHDPARPRTSTKFYGDVLRARRREPRASATASSCRSSGPTAPASRRSINVLTGRLCARRPAPCASRTATSRGIGPVALARLGMARSFQLVQIFPDLTVLETLQAAVVVAARPRPRGSSPRSPRDRRGAGGGPRGRRAVRPRRQAPRRRRASSPQGDKKLLDVASAFALRPEVILLDEPTSGVSAPRDKTAIMEILVPASRRSRAAGDHPGRARHGHRLRLLGPHRRAPPGPGARRRDARRPSRRDDGGGGTVVGRPPDALMLRASSATSTSTSRPATSCASVSLEVGERGGRLPRRPQRRRQDDHAPHDHGVPAPARRARSSSRAARSTGRATHEIARLGLGCAPEDSGVFGDLTVAENIEISTWTRPGGAPGRRAHRARLRGVPEAPRLRGAQGARSCPAASARCCRSPARWRSTPSCCCSTSRSRASSPAIIPPIAREHRRDHGARPRHPAGRVEHPPRAAEYAAGSTSSSAARSSTPGRPATSTGTPRSWPSSAPG